MPIALSFLKQVLEELKNKGALVALKLLFRMLVNDGDFSWVMLRVVFILEFDSNSEEYSWNLFILLP